MARKDLHTMQNPRTESPTVASLTSRLAADVAAIVSGESMDLSNASLFCRRQAECAATFGSIAQIKPGVFVLKSPFKESFMGSLHCYAYPNINFRPEEMLACALLRHANWYLKVRDVDAMHRRAGSYQIEPRTVHAPMRGYIGIVRPTGEFTGDPEADGTPALLAWQDNSGDPPSLAMEICGPGVGSQEPAFRLTLLRSMVDYLAVELGLRRSRAGRPALATQAEFAAYLRDHRNAGRLAIAQETCSCGNPRHTQKCFDRLNKLADSFYRTQRSNFEKLVQEHARKYPKQT